MAPASEIVCLVCEAAPRKGGSKRCAACRQLVARARNSGSKRRARIRPPEADRAIGESVALHRRLYPEQGFGYACVYTQIPLAVDKAHCRRGDYLSFDHAVPNSAGKAVLCSRIVNDLKGWMTDVEFIQFVRDVLDPLAARTIHGLTQEQTREFLTALIHVMKSHDAAPPEARQTLKQLSSTIIYERESATIAAPPLRQEVR
jgi:hypothetical protein